MKKRIIVILLILAMCLSLSACGGMLGSIMNIGSKGSSDDDLSNVLEDMEDILDELEDLPVMEAPAEEIPVDTEPAAEDWWPVEFESYALEDYIYGTWLRETMYLEHYGCDADMYTTFNHDGSAYQRLLKHDNGELLNEASGQWWFDGSDVVLQKDGQTSHIRFSYEEFTHRLLNGDKYYTKIGD